MVGSAGAAVAIAANAIPARAMERSISSTEAVVVSWRRA